MYLPFFLGLGLGLVVYCLAEQVEHASQGFLSDRHLDGSASIDSLHTSDKTVRGTHRDAAHHIIADMLCDLNDQLLTVVVDLNGIQQIGQVIRVEPDIKNRADDRDDRANVLICHF